MTRADQRDPGTNGWYWKPTTRIRCWYTPKHATASELSSILGNLSLVKTAFRVGTPIVGDADFSVLWPFDIWCVIDQQQHSTLQQTTRTY